MSDSSGVCVGDGCKWEVGVVFIVGGQGRWAGSQWSWEQAMTRYVCSPWY